MKTSEVIARLERDLDVERMHRMVLEAQLSAQNLPPLPPPGPWAGLLRKQEAELLAMLIGCYPRPMSRYEIEDRLPGRDHAAERHLNLIAVLVSRIRKKLGRDAIVNVHGDGWRAGEAIAAEHKGRVG